MPAELTAAIERLRGIAAKGSGTPWRVGPINYADLYSTVTHELVALITKDRETTVGDAALVLAAVNAFGPLLSLVAAMEAELRASRAVDNNVTGSFEPWREAVRATDAARSEFLRAVGGEE